MVALTGSDIIAIETMARSKRGDCPVCLQGVFSDEERCTDPTGAYFHRKCWNAAPAMFTPAHCQQKVADVLVTGSGQNEPDLAGDRNCDGVYRAAGTRNGATEYVRDGGGILYFDAATGNSWAKEPVVLQKLAIQAGISLRVDRRASPHLDDG